MEAEKRKHLPITPAILLNLNKVWSRRMADFDTKMIWAACCLCFFAFLRAGEMTVPGDDSYDPSVHLSIKDISVDDPKNPSMMCIKIKQSKTDPFRRGMFIYRENGFSPLSNFSYVELSVHKGNGRWSSVSIQGWQSADSSTLRDCSMGRFG